MTLLPTFAAGEQVRHLLTADLDGGWVWWSLACGLGCEQGRYGKTGGAKAGVMNECPWLPRNPTPGVGQQPGPHPFHTYGFEPSKVNHTGIGI